jgi:phage terminase large subunit GpA-like protein
MTELNIKAIKLEPGQMLLVQTCEEITYDKKQQLQDLIRNQYSHNQVILCDKNYDFNAVEGTYIASYELLRYLISSLKDMGEVGEAVLSKYDEFRRHMENEGE